MPAESAPARRRRHGAIWLLLVLLVALMTALVWPGPGWLDTDVRALLPDPSAASERAVEASNSLSRPFEQSTLWLVGAPSRQGAADAALALAKRFRDTDVFDAVRAEVDRGAAERLAAALYPYRHGLIAPADAERLRDAPAAFLRERLALQYSVAGAAGSSLARDPLGLYGRFVEHALSGGRPAGASRVDGVPVVAGERYHYAIVTAEVRRAAFAARAEPPILSTWREVRAWAEEQGLRLHATGAPLYSAYTASSAHREVTLIGGLSLLAITLLVMGRFRSPRPLILACLVVTSGVAGGFAGTLLVFGGMHLVTLVFGATVIGVSVDYAFHYLSDSLRRDWTPESGLRHVLPSLRLALATSAIAFLSLALAPFPALRQVALFTVFGLLASWLTVVLLLPLLTRPPPAAPPLRTSGRPAVRRPGLVLGVVAALALPGILLLQPRDDIRLLYAAPDRLAADDARIGELLPRPDGNRFLLVEATGPQALLQRLEALGRALDERVAAGELAGYRSVARWLPSRARQRANEQLLQGLVESGRFGDYLRQLGFGASAIAQREQAVESPGPYLAPKTVLPVAPEGQRAQWLGCNARSCSAAVVPMGAGEGEGLARLAGSRDGVHWVNRIASVNESMRKHRHLSLALLVSALAVVALVLGLLLGPRRGLRVVAVPTVALLVSLATVGYTGALFSVFNLMALLLVLGVGIDYALFYHCAPADGRPSAALGIGMAALTTILAFGLLIFSETPVIHAFGVTLLPGLATAWLLALATGRAGPAEEGGME